MRFIFQLLGLVVPSTVLSLVRLTSIDLFAKSSAIYNLFGGTNALLATPVSGVNREHLYMYMHVSFR